MTEKEMSTEERATLWNGSGAAVSTTTLIETYMSGPYQKRALECFHQSLLEAEALGAARERELCAKLRLRKDPMR